MYQEWRESCECFLAALISEIGPRPSTDHSLDRQDNNGDYGPGNMKWSTRKEQGRNRRGNRLVTALGHTRTIAEWSEITGNRWYNIGRRLDAGWTELRAVYEPARQLPRNGAHPSKSIDGIMNEQGGVTIEVHEADDLESESFILDLETALGTIISRQYAQIQPKRRATKYNAEMKDFTAYEWEAVKMAYGHRCAYCGQKSESLEQDHITPIRKGGNHTLSNSVPACRACHAHKGVNKPLVPVQPMLICEAK
jgi:5-methylcytosine-specific restriction endonuclease McrA